MLLIFIITFLFKSIAMEDLAIPEGYQRVRPYLIIKNATAFFNFTKKVFEATEKIKIMLDDTHIRHAELHIGESTIMFADSNEEFKPQTAGLFVYVQDADETYSKALAEGAISVMAMSN